MRSPSAEPVWKLWHIEIQVIVNFFSYYKNKTINTQKPTNNQNRQPKVWLQPSDKKLKTTSTPLMSHPNRPPPTKSSTIKTTTPIIVNIVISYPILIIVYNLNKMASQDLYTTGLEGCLPASGPNEL